MKQSILLGILMLGLLGIFPDNASHAQCDSLSIALDPILELPGPPPIPFELIDDIQSPVHQYGSWTELAPYPEHRYGSAGIYDPVRERLILFGGSNFIPSNDLWSLDVGGVTPVWSRLEASGPPPEARLSHTAVYDPSRDRILVFGGQLPDSEGMSNELWELSLFPEPTWNLLTVEGPPPPARGGHGALYDPVRNRLLVFGGQGSSGQFLNDVWECTLGGTLNWTQVTPSGTPPGERAYHAMVYDSQGDRAIVYAGYGATRYGDLWALDLSGSMVWSRLAETGTIPDSRSAHGAVYDPVTNELLVFGGRTDLGRENDLLAASLLEPVQWRTVALSDPRIMGRSGPLLVYDSQRQAVLLHGGFGSNGFPLEDAWEFPLRTTMEWRQLPPEMLLPHGRAAHSFTYDPGTDNYVMYGNDFTDQADAVWFMSIHTAVDGTESEEWTMVPKSGLWPTLRGEHGAVIDEKRRRLIVSMGTTISGGAAQGLSDTWALSLDGAPAWEMLDPGTGPSPRGGAALVYDNLRDRLILFGGVEFDPGGARIWKNDTWFLSLSNPNGSWEEMVTTGPIPPPRGDHMMIYDPIRDRLILYGGSPVWGSFHGDCWALNLGTENRWEELQPLGATPSPRSAAAVIYDPIRDRMVVAGGASPAPLNDAWALSFPEEGPTWSILPPVGDALPPARGSGTMAGTYDSRRDRMVTYGGASEWHYRETSTWTLTWGIVSGEPGETQILGVSPSRISRVGPGSVAVTGTGFSPGSEIVLIQGGVEIEPIASILSQNGTVIFSNFNVENLMTGPVDVAVVEPDGTRTTAPGVLEAENDPRTNLDIEFTGRDLFRPGTETVITVTCTNQGNVTVPSVPLFIAGLPGNAVVRALGGFVELAPDNSGIFDAAGSVLEMFPLDDSETEFGVCLQVANLSPAIPVQIPLGITIPDNVSVTLRAHYEPQVFWQNDTPPGAAFVEKDANGCITAIGQSVAQDVIGGFIPDWAGCGVALGSALHSTVSAARDHAQNNDTGLLNFTLDFVKNGVSAFGAGLGIAESCVGALPPNPALLLADSFFAGWGFGSAIAEDCGVSDALAEGAWDLKEKIKDLAASFSFDPNEIHGPIGAGPYRAVAPVAEMPYLILFENLPAATAAAQMVVITDQLDLEIYDPASFGFGNVTIASRIIPIAPGRRELNDVVDLRTEMGVYVLLQGSFNESTGLITWRFVTIDPASCALPADPEVGFLPPNISSPEGEGSVSFSVNLREGLPSGTAVRTGASIVFDANSAIETGDWLNMIDDAPPTSQVLALDSVQGSPEFLVEWSGSDTEAGIGGYIIYVSEEGGPFTTWIEGTKSVSAMFHGIPGRSYGFYSIAVDNLGNVEDDPGVADTITFIDANDVDLSIQEEMIYFDADEPFSTPYIGMDLRMGVFIANAGTSEATAKVRFEYETDDGVLAPIDSVQVVVPPTEAGSDGLWTEVMWTVSDISTIIHCSISDVDPDDIDLSNNLAYRELTENVVGVFIDDLEISEERGDISVSWVVGEQVPTDRFLLKGSQGGREWEVPVRSLGDFEFGGLDELSNRLNDDPVQYSLFYVGIDGHSSVLRNRTYAPRAILLPVKLTSVQPNPFNPSTTIHFTVGETQHVELAVYDLTGRRVAILEDKVFTRGRYSVEWRGTNNSGRSQPSGIYLVRLNTDHQIDTKKIMLIK